MKGDHLEVIQEVSQESARSDRSDPFVLSIPPHQKPVDVGLKQRNEYEKSHRLQPNHSIDAQLARRADTSVNEQMHDNYETLMRELARVQALDIPEHEEETVLRQMLPVYDELQRQAAEILGVDQVDQDSGFQDSSPPYNERNGSKNKVNPWNDDSPEVELADPSRKRKRKPIINDHSLLDLGDIGLSAPQRESEESEVQFDLV